MVDVTYKIAHFDHTYIRTYLPTYLPTYIHPYIPTYLSTYLPTYLPTRLADNAPANKLGNPAVVGLAGFALTTFVLQLHNLGVRKRR